MNILTTIAALLVTASVVVVAPPASQGNNKARANSYDDGWQAAWVANAQTILQSSSGQNEGMLIHIGDSLTRSPFIGNWAIGGSGQTAEDQAIVAWMHAGTSTADIDSLDGFYLQAPNKASSLGYPSGASRSYTVGDGRGAWDFMGAGGMPDVTSSQAAAQAVLDDFVTYTNDISLPTMLAAISKPQFATIQVNFVFATPGTIHPDTIAMYDLLEAQGIVPIVVTHPYRQVFNDDPGSGTTTEQFNDAVDLYNAALVSFAETREYPLVDWNQEMLERIPLSSLDTTGLSAWVGRFLSGDGVHFTGSGGGYTATSDVYANGGDSATHTTGEALTYVGYGLRGWLLIQKMKELKAEVVDTLPSSQSGLDFPGNDGATTTIRFGWTDPQNDGLPLNGTQGDGLTYVWKARYRAQTASPGYITTFFYSDDNNWFDGGGNSRGYGFTAYPVDGNCDTDFGATLNIHIHSVADGTDFPQGESNCEDYLITYDQWLTQVVFIDYTADENITYTYYPDYENDPTLILEKCYGTSASCTESSSSSRENAPVDPVLQWGDAPHNPGNEVMSGVLRGIQIYDTRLTLSELDQELASPGSSGNTPWYLNENPTPDDIADDSGNGNDPAWIGSERPDLWTN